MTHLNTQDIIMSEDSLADPDAPTASLTTTPSHVLGKRNRTEEHRPRAADFFTSPHSPQPSSPPNLPPINADDISTQLDLETEELGTLNNDTAGSKPPGQNQPAKPTKPQPQLSLDDSYHAPTSPPGAEDPEKAYLRKLSKQLSAENAQLKQRLRAMEQKLDVVLEILTKQHSPPGGPPQ